MLQASSRIIAKAPKLHPPIFNMNDMVVTKAFYLNTKPVELTNLYVTVNGVARAYPTDYSLEGDQGIIRFTSAPGNNTAIKV